MPTTPALAQQLGDGEHEVGRRRALRQRAGQPEPDDLRDQHRHGLAEHRRLGLDPADAPAEHAEAVDHRRVRVGADERVGVGLARPVVANTTRARYSRLTWWTMPVSGGTTWKRLEGLLAPAQERVALAGCARTRARRSGEGVGAPGELVDLTEWSMTSSAGTSGLTIRGSPPSAAIASRIAARSTTAGTPVKSCIRTRAGVKAIWARGAARRARPRLPPAAPAHDASASMLSAVTLSPSSWRSRFSSRTLKQKGRRPTSKRPASASKPVDGQGLAPELQRARVPKLSCTPAAVLPSWPLSSWPQALVLLFPRARRPAAGARVGPRPASLGAPRVTSSRRWPTDTDPPALLPNRYRGPAAVRSALTTSAGRCAWRVGWHAKRDHGGLVFIDLRDPAGPDADLPSPAGGYARGDHRASVVQLVSHPEDAAFETLAQACAWRASSRSPARWSARPDETVNPEAGDR